MKLVPLEHLGKRILLTFQLAESFGTESQKIIQNFNNNKDRYSINKHYFLLEGDELRAFKKSNIEIFDFAQNLNKVYLWTEKGAWMVAKSLNTDEAWEAYEMLVDDYYYIKSEAFQLPQSMPEALRLLAAEMESKAIMAADNERLAIETTEQKKKLKEQEAPIAIYNLAISAKNTMSMQEVAKSLGTGRTRLYEILREESVVMKESTLPYQRFLDAGYFKVSERPRASGDTVVNDPATRVYAKGFEYIAKLLQKRAERNGQAAELLE